jgi:hypothetical protein
MGAAKLAIKTKYQVAHQENDQDKNSPDNQALFYLFPDQPPSHPVARRIRDLIDLKAIVEFTFLFLNLYVAELVIDKKGIITGGVYRKINDHNASITIDQQVTRIVPVKQANFMEGAIISNVCPVHLAHKKVGKATKGRYNNRIISCLKRRTG